MIIDVDLMDRSLDWLEQSKRDLIAAKKMYESKIYEWSCFLSQQAAEKAVKAVCEKKKIECWGHSISIILKKLFNNVPKDIIDYAKILDRYYIPTRYPNGFETGSPKDYYTEKDAREAIEYAQKIIDFCEEHIH